MKVFFKSLQSRLIALILLVAFPGLAGLIYESILERDVAIRSALDQAINTVEITTNFQAHLIKNTALFLQNIATFETVMDPDSPECSHFLSDALRINTNYINLGIPKANGELTCNALPMTQRINVSDRPYFQNAINNKEFSIGRFQIDRAAGLTSINFAYPVITPDNKTVGVAVAVISLDWWSKRLSETKLPANTIAYITDDENKIIATYPKNNQLLGTNLSSIHPDIVQDADETSVSNERIITEGDNQWMFVQRPLFDHEQPVKITVGIPFGDKIKSINARRIKTAAILIVIILTMLSIAIWGIRYTLLAPLKTLIQSTKDLELGRFVETTFSHASSELVELQQRFTSMARTRLNAEKQLRNSQKSLQESENALYNHIKNTPLGCISWDSNLVCTSWNRSAENIFGYRQEEAIGKHASELIIIPEQQDELTNVYQLLLANKGGNNKTNENRTKDGNIIICEWHSTPIISQSGSVIGVTSLVQDVTKNKQLEEKLRLAASVFSHAREGIIITDTQGNIIDVNETFVSITGYEREEVLGKNPNILKSDRQPSEFYQQLWLSITQNGYWSGEIWNKRKNNEEYAQLLTISAVQDNNGKVKNYIAIFTDISEAKKQQYKLEHMAHYDVLTNLPNRTLLSQRLNQALNESKNNSSLVAVMLLDLDGFKEINDAYGHNVGDELLVVLAARLQKTLGDHDTLSRFGGDEFVAVLANLKDESDYLNIVEKMLKVAAEPISFGNNVLRISASIGVTLYPTDNTDAEQLIRHADQAMYVAKQKGKNCYHLFDIESEDAIKARHEMAHNAAQALKKGEFVLYYQPKVNMRSGEIIGAEALIRWQHPEKGLLSPGAFLPYIENHQLNIDIGEWVIKESLHQIGVWQQAGLNVPVSVNVSALQIQQKNFVSRLESLLLSAPHVAPQFLQLEVLETSRLSNLTYVSDVINACIKLGVTFAIDDFGTGYSSLTYLRRLPASTIKIDQTFVRDMLFDPDDKAIVEGVIALAKSFNRKVIAEGVESVEHGKKLLELGCELAQGYGIARPMPANDMVDWANHWKTNREWKSKI